MSGIMEKLKKHVMVFLKKKLNSCHHEANNLNREVGFNQQIMHVNPKITTLQKAERANGNYQHSKQREPQRRVPKTAQNYQ